MDIRSFIKNSKNKTFTRLQLMQASGCRSEEELFRIVSECIASGIIEPVKASGTNGNRMFTLYGKYRRTDDSSVEINDHVLDEICSLNPVLIKNRYLIDNPDKYIKYQKEIKLLNEYLSKDNDLSIPVSRKERSFAVFGEEKLLDNSSFCTFLERTGADRTILKWYDTPEYCFLEYIPHRLDKMDLLICENKDIWFNLRRMMYEYNKSGLFGIHLDGVIYGDGNKATNKEALTCYSRYIMSKQAKFYYWGDIDREGIRMLQRCIKVNPELQISAFVPAYDMMLELARNITLPDSTDMRNTDIDSEFIYRSFGADTAVMIEKLLTENKRLPQEIINFSYLYTTMK